MEIMAACAGIHGMPGLMPAGMPAAAAAAAAAVVSGGRRGRPGSRDPCKQTPLSSKGFKNFPQKIAIITILITKI